ncbi:MAG: bifunctional phosphoribosylaminoimidazolecarboxamide formyltransferase/IMP cyclohydrolase [Deferribacteraceae bacterium]|jgi:phosphoribosylaminoimidazolecarboxamide formyltransferase/IMP cyclohydrolase|nr:bifunctional phosphoribosylaminoimidazolecarboxamide formyltransferase/IMP cyclohydrolase [Deferribacteraceae bacterium]
MAERYALLSVSDKTGIALFAEGLVRNGFNIISTGGTAGQLREAGINAQEIADFTGFPEILDGRVKTLNPKVHGGILNIRNDKKHQATAAEHGIKNIDLVAVNLYPFEQTVVKPGVSFDEIIENVDIGGPSMVRSAAKNHAFVTVVVHTEDYKTVLEEIEKYGDTTPETRLKLAAKAYSHTALYDSVISGYLNARLGVKFPTEYTTGGRLKQNMRYGENPHQQAAFYSSPLNTEAGPANAAQRHGKELSFNNIADINAANELIKEFSQPAAVIIKHTNPCGAAVAGSAEAAYDAALACDPASAFGGVAAFNRGVDITLAKKLAELFFEVIIAPAFTEDAFELLRQKKSIRLMHIHLHAERDSELDFKKVTGGFLLQERDLHTFEHFGGANCPTKRKPAQEELNSLCFAWSVAKHVKSNAIIYARDTHTVGIGAGQMSRVDSGRIAAIKAQSPLKGCVMASDAFFPFRDSVDEAARHGITAIVSPGGSVRDTEVIAAADEAGIAMIFTGIRHFRH